MTSIRYAICSLTEQESGDTLAIFLPVPKEIAEDDHENGFSAVFTTTGEQASRWVKVHNPYVEEDLAKIKPFPALADMFNTPLNIGDYALSAFNERSNYVSLCRVVGFTNKQVRVLHLDWCSVMSRNAAMLVRVHDSIIAPETI